MRTEGVERQAVVGRVGASAEQRLRASKKHTLAGRVCRHTRDTHRATACLARAGTHTCTSWVWYEVACTRSPPASSTAARSGASAGGGARHSSPAPAR